MGEARKVERELALEAAELTTCDPQTSAILCDTFLYEPETGEESLGSLFLVAETINLATVSGTAGRPQPTSLDPLAEEALEPNASRTVIETMSSALRKEHYRDSQRSLLSSFEAALEAANAALAAYAERGESAWLDSLHAAVGVFQNTTLHVSRVGDAELLLARHGHLTDIGEGLSDANVRHPHRAFTSTASGTMAEHDVVVLASRELARLIPRDRLAAFLTGKSPRETATYIRDLLAETAQSASFAALFLRAARAPIALPAPRSFSEVGPAPPLDRELGAERRNFGEVGTAPRVQTPETPSGIREARPAVAYRPALPAPPRLPYALRRTPPVLRQSLARRALTVARRMGTLLAHQLTHRLAPTLTRAARTGASEVRAVAAKTAGAAASRFAQNLPARGNAPERPPGRAPAPLALIQTMAAHVWRAPWRIRGALTHWPASTKIFFVLTLVFAILFAGSIVLLKRKRTEETAVRSASEKLEEARTKKQAADAALIYDNVDEARQHLKAARESAAAVEATAYYDAQVNELLQGIQAVEDRAERITRLPEPERVGDFGSVVPSGRVLGLQVIGPHLYAFSPETNAILRLALEGGETRVVSQTSQGIGYFKEVTPLAAEQMLLYATDAPGLALFDTARGDLIKQELQSLPEGTKEIRSLATFGSRLYLLLPEHRQIFGFSKTLAGFTGGAAWLKDQNVPAERAISLGVDGYIYLLTTDGKIVKLLKGAPVEFAQTELATPLTAPTKLVINETLKHLYVLDAREKRVVVYDTTGKLTRQFVFPNARDLRDLAIGGKEDTLYALDGTAVYKMTLK